MPRIEPAYLAFLCALAYPALAHGSVLADSVTLAAAAVGVLGAASLIPGLARGRLGAWIAAAVLALACWRLALAPIPQLPLYAPPFLVPAFMSWVFGQTLLAGQTPLIAQLIREMHAGSDIEPPPGVWDYARRLTLLWTLLFVFIATVNLVLGLIAAPDGVLLASGVTPPVTVPQEWWSWFANVIGYGLVAALFIIEYAWRRRRFPNQPYRNMLDFLRRMLIAMPTLVARR